jgi:L-lactate dehydrogenase complex protein LldF
MKTYLGLPTASRGVGALRGDRGFPAAARDALANPQLRKNLGHATRTIRAKRAAVVGEVPDWEELRLAGAAIKKATMASLDVHLERLEREVTARGGTVHWASDAVEANRIVTDLVRATGAREVVKVKSMATQEIGLNEALEAAGIAAVETDLAELIVQLGHDKPSHILVPAIHRNRSEIREIFQREMDDAPADLTDEPRRLAMAARAHLRRRFLSARVAVSGANFAVAETGTLAVVESEGNGRMCLTLPQTLITVMGIEKIVPTWEDLGVFLQLLPRSSTGERMNPYTSMWSGVTPGDGPQEFHLVLLDNGRTATLADEVGREALHCIRCSACLNVCPVYERTGGHAYGSVYPGPIGAVDGRRRERHAAVRVIAVWSVLRRLPGAHRHPSATGAPAGPGRRGEATTVRRGDDDGRGRLGHGVPQALRRRGPRRPRWTPARTPRPHPRAAAAAVGLDRHPRRARSAEGDVPPVVAPHVRGHRCVTRYWRACAPPSVRRPRWTFRATTARAASSRRERRNCLSS